VTENGLAERLLAVTEEELQRIVLDVHDGPVQHLYAALSQLSSLRRLHTSAVSGSELALLDRVITLLESSLKEIRNLLSTLRAPGFAERGLEDLLEGAVVEHEALGGGHVSLALAITRDVVLPVKVCLFRILQEALSNVRRHADVQEARVSVQEAGERLVLTIADHGRGFDPPPLTGPCATDRPEHIGLRGMRERAAFMGGTLTVESSPGHGTRVRVEVPFRG
jgi:signal transduction histidine kinase